MHTLICVTFSLPPGVRSWLQLLLVALPGLFCLPLSPHYFNTDSSKAVPLLWFPFGPLLNASTNGSITLKDKPRRPDGCILLIVKHTLILSPAQGYAEIIRQSNYAMTGDSVLNNFND